MTTGKSRQSLGFGDELDNLDPAAWAMPVTERVKPDEAKKAAEAAGFRSREPAAPYLGAEAAPSTDWTERAI